MTNILSIIVILILVGKKIKIGYKKRIANNCSKKNSDGNKVINEDKNVLKIIFINPLRHTICIREVIYTNSNNIYLREAI